MLPLQGGTGSIPGQGTNIPHATGHGQKKQKQKQKKKRTKNKLEGKLQTHPPVLDSSLGWLVETVTAHFFQL